MKKNQWRLGEEVSLRGMRSLNDLSIHIVGILNQSSDLPDVVAVQYEYLKEHMKDGGVFSVALLQVEDPYQVPWLRDVVEERFQNSMVPVEVITEKGFIESLLGEYSSMVDAIRWIAWITLIATLFVLGNTMAMSIRERSVDQGVLRTLGFSRARVFWLYLSESVLLSTVGGLLGGLAGCYIFYQWELILPGSPGVQGLLLEPFWILMRPVALLSLLMGVASGLPPALFASRKRISQTLRFVP
jgi:putative ABC transport system permease protein